MVERDLAREPCPDRIVEDLGGAFGMGCVGGFVWNFGKAMLWDSPVGGRFNTAFYKARNRSPALGGNFAVWGGTFSVYDCTLQHIRGKEDHWNAIASGFLTGGTLALRGGWRSASRNAVIGGVLLTIIEGVSLVIQRKWSPSPRQQFMQQQTEMARLKDQSGRIPGSTPTGLNSSGGDTGSTNTADPSLVLR